MTAPNSSSDEPMAPTGSPAPAVSYEVRRLIIDVDAPFDEFRHRYEEAVPALDESRFGQLVSTHAAWDDVLAAANANAPHGFLVFWGRYVTQLMSLAGNDAPCASYLMGNPTIAERMFRHHPGVMLYAPLRVVLYAQNPHGPTTLSVDQPSSHFSSFGIPEITKIGIELDHKLAALLRTLGAPVPSVLAA